MAETRAGRRAAFPGAARNMIALSEHKRREPSAPTRSCWSPRTCRRRAGWCWRRRLGIPTWAQSHKGMEREPNSTRLLDAVLRRARVEIVALAGYMRLLSPELRPRMGGPDPQHPPVAAAPAQGARHPPAGDRGGRRSRRAARSMSSPRSLDDGPVLAQAHGQDPAARRRRSLAARVLAEEHRLYPRRWTNIAGRSRGRSEKTGDERCRMTIRRSDARGGEAAAMRRRWITLAEVLGGDRPC